MNNKRNETSLLRAVIVFALFEAVWYTVFSSLGVFQSTINNLSAGAFAFMVLVFIVAEIKVRI